MGTHLMTLCLLLPLVLLVCTTEGSFESQCVVNGTVVNFHCYYEESWRINSAPTDDAIVTFIISNETGRRDDMVAVADQDYIEQYSNISLIQCLPRDGTSLFAILVIAEQQLFPMLTPLTWSSLLLDWQSPSCCYAFEYVDYNYTVTLTAADGLIVADSVVSYGNATPSIIISLEGYECEELVIEISLPGNCEPARLGATLLLDPVYPQPQQLETVLLNSDSFALTWKHPNTSNFSEIIDDEYFTYNISAVLVDTGALIAQYEVTISSTDTPWEVMELGGGVEACQKINFTVSLVRDCRVLHNTTTLPSNPAQEFSSNPLHVKVLFTADQILKKIEIKFTTPLLCSDQWAAYTVIFTNLANGDSWSSDSEVLTGSTPGSEVEVDVTEVQRFLLEKTYKVTVTITTELGNVSSDAIFDTCTLWGKAPHEISLTSIARNNPTLSWQQLCNITSDLPLTYVITATLISSGATIHQSTLTVVGDDAVYLPLHLEEYSCEIVNYTISYGHRHTESIVDVLPAYPSSFEQNVTIDTSFDSYGTFKGVDIEFKPPRLCEFQSSSYIVSYTDGNMTWFHDPVAITNPSQLIKETIDDGMESDVDYTVTVTVFSDTGNLSSSSAIGSNIQAKSTGISDVQIYIGVGVLLVCVFGGAIVVAVPCCLRQRNKRRILALSTKKPRTMVQNPLYEAAEDDNYEHLPDCKGHPPPSLPLYLPTTTNSAGQLYTDITPQLPPPRTITDATGGESVLTATDKSPKHVTSMQLAESKSLGGMSQYSGEDCYTIMSPAGTLTMLPRITITCTDGMGDSLSFDAKCVDDMGTA